MACTALILVGALAFTLRGAVRVILAGLGVCGLVISFWVLIYLKDKHALRADEADLRSAAAGVSAALKDGSYLEAQSRYRNFMALAMPDMGRFRSAQAERISGEIRQSLDKWLKDTYGQLSPQEASLLVYLMNSYSEKAAGGSRRFSNLKISETVVTLHVVVDREASTNELLSEDDLIFAKARRVFKTLRDQCPEAQRYELGLAAVAASGETKEYGTLIVKAGQESIVEMGGDLRTLLKK